MRFPDGLLYSPTHEWVRVEGNFATIGITDFAQREMGELTYIELPDVGDHVEAGQPFGVMDSVKASEELYSPVSGTVVKVNNQLVDNPGLVNQDPYGDGWLIVVEMPSPDEVRGLLTAQSYVEMLRREGRL
ncbi:MAG: glycine cleavage system protein GcvH [Armatimonadota bacterium]|nr:glycine cleavage system protein GcvH [Armatimonadota bacterium]MCX7778031.1 glycine cleavage system protein GcvH [Armatimonadota bacterium]MDW8024971.1 glycine cleavage system protein GcvH [Armatimonadota bacterium]